METRQKLDTALKEAMRSGDEMRKQNIRMILSAIKLSEVEKGAGLEEPEVLAIVQKELKLRQEARQEALNANRPDLVEKAELDSSFIESFLPKQLSEEELDAIVREVIAEVGAASPGEMGKVMKSLMPKIQGRATGNQVSQAVRKHLQT